jgi:hypothetical protein
MEKIKKQSFVKLNGTKNCHKKIIGAILMGQISDFG